MISSSLNVESYQVQTPSASFALKQVICNVLDKIIVPHLSLLAGQAPGQIIQELGLSLHVRWFEEDFFGGHLLGQASARGSFANSGE